jgi:hypothetical protein
MLALLVAWAWATIVLLSDFEERDDDGIEVIRTALRRRRESLLNQ